MRKQLLLVLGGILIVTFIVTGTLDIRNNKRNIELRNLEIKSQEAKLIELNKRYDEVIHLQTKTEKEKKQQSEKIEQLETERERLERELQAKLDRQSAEKEKLAKSAKNASGVASAHAATLEVNGNRCNTGNKYKDFIYYKESTCNPGAVNSIGCRGIGQACPGTKLPCGDDFACQDAWFSNYAMTRYGSWEAAYNFWINNNWW